MSSNISCFLLIPFPHNSLTPTYSFPPRRSAYFNIALPTPLPPFTLYPTLRSFVLSPPVIFSYTSLPSVELKFSACEIQSNAFTRRYPSLRVASLRFHAVTADDQCTTPTLHKRGGLWKDLWGWVSLSSTAQACLSALTVDEEKFPVGHETFFIVAPTTMQQTPTIDLLKEAFPELVEKYGGVVEGNGNQGLISTAKAKRMLGWEERISNRMD